MFETIYAQVPKPLGGGIGTGDGLGPFSNVNTAVGGLMGVTKIISGIIGIMTIAAGIWFFFNFIIGGIQWISAGGDKHNLEQARQRITNAFVGLIIVVAGWTILALASKFTGFDFLITNPAGVISNFKI